MLEIENLDIGQIRRSAEDACTLLRTLANEDRLLLLCQLAKGERRVGELEELLDIRQPTLSQQLSVLRNEGLVATRRDGKHIYYSIASIEALRVLETLYELFCAKQQEPSIC